VTVPAGKEKVAVSPVALVNPTFKANGRSNESLIARPTRIIVLNALRSAGRNSLLAVNHSHLAA
jgi:hypothetical protein